MGSHKALDKVLLGFLLLQKRQKLAKITLLKFYKIIIYILQWGT